MLDAIVRPDDVATVPRWSARLQAASVTADPTARDYVLVRETVRTYRKIKGMGR